jgi:hypothetical protein
VAIFGAGWLAGVVGSLGNAFNVSALRTIGSIGRFVLPTDGLWRGAIYYLEPRSLIDSHLTGRTGDPFLVLGAPSWPYLLWVACWFAAVILIGAVSFQRREL